MRTRVEGRLLHELDATLPAQGEVYAELYLHAHGSANVVSLFRSGTRVLDNIAELEAFARSPWTSGYIQGIIDAPYLDLTPGTRLGVIHDAALARLTVDLAPLEARLAKIVADQQHAEEERTSRDVLRSVQGALKEALLALPADEYDWFDLNRGDGRRRPAVTEEPAAEVNDNEHPDGAEPQRQFFEYAGPLFSAVISPTRASSRSTGRGRCAPSRGTAPGARSTRIWSSHGESSKARQRSNNGHRDFVYAARNRMLKLRYICRLFAKELVLRNFAGVPQDELLERLLELTLYTEEHLR